MEDSTISVMAAVLEIEMAADREGCLPWTIPREHIAIVSTWGDGDMASWRHRQISILALDLLE